VRPGKGKRKTTGMTISLTDKQKIQKNESSHSKGQTIKEKKSRHTLEGISGETRAITEKKRDYSEVRPKMPSRAAIFL